MSSAASLFSQRVREGIGLASKTADSDITEGFNRLSELEKDVFTLRKVLETANKALNSQVPAAKLQMVGVMSELAEKLVGPHSETSTFVKVFQDVHKYMDKDLPEKLNAAFEKAVLQPLDEWLKSLADVKADVKLADEKRLVFDHYKEKVDSLREAKRKSQTKGKVVDRATEERLARNDEKLTAAESEYSGVRDRTVGRLLFVFQEAESQLEAVLLRVMQYEMQVSKDTGAAVRSFEGAVPTLLGRVKDHKAAVSVGHLETCIRFARSQREAGKAIKFSELAETVSSLRSEATTPTSASAGAAVSAKTAPSAPASTTAATSSSRSYWDQGSSDPTEPATKEPASSGFGNPFGGFSSSSKPAAANTSPSNPFGESFGGKTNETAGKSAKVSTESFGSAEVAKSEKFEKPEARVSTTQSSSSVQGSKGGFFSGFFGSGAAPKSSEKLDDGERSRSESFEESAKGPSAPKKVDTASSTNPTWDEPTKTESAPPPAPARTASAKPQPASFDPFSSKSTASLGFDDPFAPSQGTAGTSTSTPITSPMSVAPSQPASRSSFSGPTPSLKPPTSGGASAALARRKAGSLAPPPSNSPLPRAPPATTATSFADPFAASSMVTPAAAPVATGFSNPFGGAPAPAASSNPFGASDGWGDFGSSPPPPVPPRRDTGISSSPKAAADPNDPFADLLS